MQIASISNRAECDSDEIGIENHLIAVRILALDIADSVYIAFGIRADRIAEGDRAVVLCVAGNKALDLAARVFLDSRLDVKTGGCQVNGRCVFGIVSMPQGAFY